MSKEKPVDNKALANFVEEMLQHDPFMTLHVVEIDDSEKTTQDLQEKANRIAKVLNVPVKTEHVENKKRFIVESEEEVRYRFTFSQIFD